MHFDEIAEEIGIEAEKAKSATRLAAGLLLCAAATVTFVVMDALRAKHKSDAKRRNVTEAKE